MGKGGGGGVDTSGLEKATREATQLQKEIFDITRQDVQPWYQLGVGATGRLSDLLGVGGGSIQSRDAIYNELLPQYTTQQTAPYSGMYTNAQGQIVTPEGLVQSETGDLRRSILNQYMGDPEKFREYATMYGYTPVGGEQTSSVNYDALNAAVDERLASQTRPDDYGSLLKRFSMEDFEQDPGYQFRKEEAQKALERSLAAQGITLGGAGAGEINPVAARGLEELSQNLASQEYGQSYNRYVQDQLNQYNMLMGAAGMGQGSTGILATGAQNYATNVGNLQTGLASAQLNAQMAGQAQQGSMFNTLLGAGGQLGAAYLMSDMRVKENIYLIGEENGFPVYTFNYIDDPVRYKGVMAQDVEKTMPDAVQEIDGIKHVNYDAIGVKMEVVQ